MNILSGLQSKDRGEQAENVAYVFLGVAGACIVSLMLCAVLMLIWSTPIPTAVFTGLGMAAVGATAAGAVTFIAAKIAPLISGMSYRIKKSGIFANKSKTKSPDLAKNISQNMSQAAAVSAPKAAALGDSNKKTSTEENTAHRKALATQAQQTTLPSLR